MKAFRFAVTANLLYQIFNKKSSKNIFVSVIKIKGLRKFRKPFRRCSRFMIFGSTCIRFTFSYFFLIRFADCGFLIVPSVRSVLMLSTGLFLILFCIQLLFSFCFPFLKLSFAFLRFKQSLNCGQQCPCERVDFVVRHARRVLFLSRHSPFYLCNLSDTIPPFKRLFSCQGRSRKIVASVCASRRTGVAQNKNLRKPWSIFISSRSRSISFAVDLSCAFISDSVSSTCFNA